MGIRPLTPIQRDIIWNVIDERQSQDEKWGEQHHDDPWWNVILTEETGEVAKAIYERDDGITFSLKDLREELVQVAAVAIAWVEDIDSRG